MSLKKHQIANRAHWAKQASSYVEPAEESWSNPNPKWGIWGISEDQLKVFPEDLRGKSCIEIGCGTGYVSSWMARRGACGRYRPNAQPT